MTDSLWPHLHVSEDECNTFKLGLPESTQALAATGAGAARGPATGLLF